MPLFSDCKFSCKRRLEVVLVFVLRAFRIFRAKSFFFHSQLNAITQPTTSTFYPMSFSDLLSLQQPGLRSGDFKHSEDPIAHYPFKFNCILLSEIAAPSLPSTHLFETLKSIDEFSSSLTLRDVEMQVRYHACLACPTSVNRSRADRVHATPRLLYQRN